MNPWWWLVPALAFGALAALGWRVRRGICLRRKDCCGKGCGCLFPVKRE